MGPNEIVEYAAEVLWWTCLGGVSYASILLGVSLPQHFGKRINSQEELEKIVAEEAPKLGLDPSNIHSSYGIDKYGNGISCYSVKLAHGYGLHIGHPFFATRGVIRHELYHIADGHCDNMVVRSKFKNLLAYLLNDEPKAIIYGSFKLKL